MSHGSGYVRDRAAETSAAAILEVLVSKDPKCVGIVIKDPHGFEVGVEFVQRSTVDHIIGLLVRAADDAFGAEGAS